MASSRRFGRSRITLVLLILTSLVLLTLDFRGFGPLDRVRSGAMAVFTPVGNVGSSIFRPVGNLWDGAFKYDDVRKQNQDLQTQLDQLQAEAAQAQASDAALRALLEQNHLPNIADVATVKARVTSGPVGNFDTNVQIDRGTADGVAKNMPVMVGVGLVGTVTQTSEHVSSVRLITDSSTQIGVSIVSTQSVGVAHGQGAGRQLVTTLSDTAVTPGQVVVTKGVAGGLFPPDLPIGTITAINTDAGLTNVSATVAPTADLDNLSYVSVLKWP